MSCHELLRVLEAPKIAWRWQVAPYFFSKNRLAAVTFSSFAFGSSPARLYNRTPYASKTHSFSCLVSVRKCPSNLLPGRERCWDSEFIFVQQNGCQYLLCPQHSSTSLIEKGLLSFEVPFSIMTTKFSNGPKTEELTVVPKLLHTLLGFSVEFSKPDLFTCKGELRCFVDRTSHVFPCCFFTKKNIMKSICRILLDHKPSGILSITQVRPDSHHPNHPKS